MFDATPDRRGTGSSKWDRFADDVLPLWVADMDFAVAPAIVEALRRRLDHPVFGYSVADARLRQRIVGMLANRHGWQVMPEDLVFLPGVEPGFNMALRAFLAPGDAVAVQTPVYRPILNAPGHWNLRRLDLPLQRAEAGWHLDHDAFAAGIGAAKAFLLCNPHNPTGVMFSRADLQEMARACLEAGALIISDEIHCDLAFDGRRHVPIATIGPEVADRTITLMAASKSYNIAGLKTAFAVITNPALRETFTATRLGMVDSVNVFGLVATEAAYGAEPSWLEDVLAYLQTNRDYLTGRLAERFPGFTMAKPNATFLAWIDCRASGLDQPQRFFLDRARVGLSDGAEFGAQGEGFVRLNFGCSRATLDEALDRMARSLAAR